jgi:CO/xanthine dehydrogenase FAD-binding subunit
MDLNTVEEVVAATPASTDDWREGDAWLGGGTALFSEPQRDLRRLIDLGAFGWEPLAVDDDGLEVAATCTLAQLAAWPGDPRWPGSRLVSDCCEALLGSFKIWNAATVGGNICSALPAGPMTSLAVALDGVCTIWGPGGRVRELAAADFVIGASANALAPGELLRSVSLPARALRARSAFRQLSLSPLGRSAVVVTGRLGEAGAGADDEAGDEFALTITASVARPVHLVFDGLPEPDELRDAVTASVERWYDDVHGDPAWRAHLTVMFAEEVRVELQARTVRGS